MKRKSSKFALKSKRRGTQSSLLLIFGLIIFGIGMVMSVHSHLWTAFNDGLNSGNENAAIFDLIGIICLLAGWGLRRAD